MTSTTDFGRPKMQQRLRQPLTTGTAVRVGKRIFSTSMTLVLALTAALFLFLAVGPRFLGYQTSTMLTGSMSPEINPGDVVVSVPVPVDELRVGDIITYSIPVDDHRIETHRIIDVSLSGNVATVQTKGDANPAEDPWKAVLSGNHVYRNVATVPYLGTAIRTLREPFISNVLLYGATTVLVGGVLLSIWAKKPEEGGKAAEATEADT